MKAFRSIFILFLIIFLLGCDSKKQLSPIASDATILAFGDSLTFGTGAAESQSYPSVLASLSGRQVINAGIPGETTRQGLLLRKPEYKSDPIHFNQKGYRVMAEKIYNLLLEHGAL